MTLFEECKEALEQDFNLVDNEKEVIKLLQTFPLKKNYMIWDRIEYKDYDCMEELLSDFSDLAKIHFYVLADNADIPVFQSNLKLIIDNR